MVYTQELYGVLSATIPWNIEGLHYSTAPAGGYNTYKYTVEVVDIHGASRRMQLNIGIEDEDWLYAYFDSRSGNTVYGRLELPEYDWQHGWYVSKGALLAAGVA